MLIRLDWRPPKTKNLFFALVRHPFPLNQDLETAMGIPSAGVLDNLYPPKCYVNHDSPSNLKQGTYLLRQLVEPEHQDVKQYSPGYETETSFPSLTLGTMKSLGVKERRRYSGCSGWLCLVHFKQYNGFLAP